MTGPRNAAAVASLVLLCAAAGCTNFYEIPIETPIQPKMDVTPFTRILVAGFISGGSDDVDGNLETVRLLRSQLRSKSSLRVIEAEVLPLVELAREQSKDATAATAATSTETSGGGPAQPPAEPAPPSPAPQQPPVGEGAPQQLPPTAPTGQPTTTGAGVESTDGKIRNEKDLERYQSIFENTAFWKKLGEQHQNPLIVTGTVLFTNTQSAGFVSSEKLNSPSASLRAIFIFGLRRQSGAATALFFTRRSIVISAFHCIQGRRVCEF